MNAHERRFKSILATAANAAGVNYGKFRYDHDVDELFTDVLNDDDDVFVVAARAIVHLCTDADGVYNRNVIGLKAAIQFLSESTDDGPYLLADVRECQLDLQRIAKDFESILEWCRRWYKI